MRRLLRLVIALFLLPGIQACGMGSGGFGLDFGDSDGWFRLPPPPPPGDPAPTRPSWGWKRADSPDDALNFINGLGGYGRAHAVVTIAATDVIAYAGVSFYLFYRGDLTGQRDWGYKLANSMDNAHDFVNSTGAYSGPRVQDLMFDQQSANRMHMFYRKTGPGATWGSKRSTGLDDMLDFLNGSGPYVTAREGGIGGLGTHEVVMLYRTDVTGEATWGWKLAETTDDAHNFLNGKGGYGEPVQDAKIFATPDGHFYIFYRD